MELSQRYNAFIADTAEKRVIAAEIDKATIEDSFFIPMIGRDENAIIRTYKSEKAGLVTVRLRELLRGLGVKNNSDFKTNQGKLKYLTMSVFVEIFGHSIGSEDKRFEQIINDIDWTSNAADALQEWMTDMFDRKVHAAAANNYTNVFACSITGEGGAYAKAANGSITDLCKQITEHDLVTVRSIRGALTRASIGIDHNGVKVPVMRPFATKILNNNGIKIKKPMYIIMLDTYGISQLKSDPEYQSGVFHGQIKGSENPMFTGEVCNIDGSIIVDAKAWSDEYAGLLSCNDDHVPYLNEQIEQISLGQYAGASGLTTSLGAIMGATAFACPVSEDATLYVDDKEDKGRKQSMGIDKLLGLRKSKFVGTKPEEKESIYHNKDLSMMGFIYPRV